jgi:integrative and conjugative element protein (TIGR02256 family)
LSVIDVGKFSVRFAPGVQAAITKASALSVDGLETGGILLGRDPNPDGLIEAVRAAGPGPHAIRGRSCFLRDLSYSRRLARLAFEREGLQWVGDWHTHPRGPQGPSDFDLRTYASHLCDPELNFEAFVAVIVTPVQEQDWDGCLLNANVFSLSASPLTPG